VGKEEFLNSIELTIVAASSGRPNSALEVSRVQAIAPLLLQAGANPIALIEELVRRMGDEKLDVQKFFPVPGMMPQAAPPQGKPPGGQQVAASPAPTGPPGPGTPQGF
jgi:hypothetical protein